MVDVAISVSEKPNKVRGEKMSLLWTLVDNEYVASEMILHVLYLRDTTPLGRKALTVNRGLISRCLPDLKPSDLEPLTEDEEKLGANDILWGRLAAAVETGATPADVATWLQTKGCVNAFVELWG